MSSRNNVLAALGAALLLGVVAMDMARAARLGEHKRQKQAAEAERAELHQKLTALKRDIQQTEKAKDHAADALAQSESAISEADRALHDLSQNQRDAEAKLALLTQEQARLFAAAAAGRRKLARLLHDQYVAGNEDRIKLLLSGDNPNRINRELEYMGYVSKAQAKLIGDLQTDLQAIEDNKTEAQNARDELREIAQKQRAQKTRLEEEKTRRAGLLAQLSSKLGSQRREAGNMERDEQRLGSLVDKLGKLIEEQRKEELRKAEAAAQERLRQQQLQEQQRRQLARAKASTGAAAGNQPASKVSSVKAPVSHPDAIDNDEPPKLSARNELVPENGIQDGLFSRAFDSLRGRLRLPVRGEMIARYGNRRGGGPAWKGLFIRAPEGTEVKAVANGKVVFADWLRGFGNLIIIDHGNEYMTIYGNNQSVLKHAGDTVKAGDVIASAGNSGGNEQSGLYFEMRHRGRAIDPSGWILTR